MMSHLGETCRRNLRRRCIPQFRKTRLSRMGYARDLLSLLTALGKLWRVRTNLLVAHFTNCPVNLPTLLH